MTVIEEFAADLRRAEIDRKPITPLTSNDQSLSVADAYAIQSANVQARIVGGEVVRGHKVGLTSKAMQDMLGVDEPDFGVIFDTMLVESGDCLDLSDLIAPRVEGEIAFLLGDDLVGPGITTAHVLAATRGVIPALEIIDSRIADWKIGLVDTIADNASSARLVLGQQMVSPENIDLRLVGMAFSVNGVVVETGAGAAALGHPARCVAWLANRLATFGESLRAGEVILPGALHRAVAVGAGDHVRAEFGQLGSVDVRFG
jgi:2-keto-4-pentenoate hydratase